MLTLGAARYFLYRKPIDIRKSFDGLCGLVSEKLRQNPMSGDVFIFTNKHRNHIKLLKWEPGGFVIFYKRLEKGTFEIPDLKNEDVSQAIDYGELAMIITGISMKYARKRQRFLQQNDVGK
jgi:transposase